MTEKETAERYDLLAVNYSIIRIQLGALKSVVNSIFNMAYKVDACFDLSPFDQDEDEDDEE